MVALSTSTLLLLLAAGVSGAGSFPRVRIFNPQEGDIWFGGSTRTITWQMAYLPPPPEPPTLNITLVRASAQPNGGGASAVRLPLVTDYDTQAFGYRWLVPADIPTASDYVIRINPNRAFPRPGRPNIMASKSKPFTIIGADAEQAVQVVSPGEDAFWFTGQFRTIRWQVQTPAGDGRDLSSAFVSLFIVETKEGLVGRRTPYVIASKIPGTAAGDGAFTWQVPYAFGSSDGYQIRVVAEFADGATPVVGQSGLFTIVQSGDASTNASPTVVILPIDPTPEVVNP